METTVVYTLMSYPQMNYETDVVARLTVRDEESGYLIVEVPLTAEQVVALIHSSGVKTTATIPSAASRARFGMHRTTRSVRIPRDVTGYVDPAVKAREWADTAMAETNAAIPDGYPLWQECSVVAHNHGWSATFVRWDTIVPDMPLDSDEDI